MKVTGRKREAATFVTLTPVAPLWRSLVHPEEMRAVAIPRFVRLDAEHGEPGEVTAVAEGLRRLGARVAVMPRRRAEEGAPARFQPQAGPGAPDLRKAVLEAAGQVPCLDRERVVAVVTRVMDEVGL